MTPPTPEVVTGRRPGVLLLNENDWTARALETVLQPAGYVVARSRTQQEGVRRARTRKPDAIIVDVDLPDGTGPQACRILGSSPEVGHRTPLVMWFGERPSRRARRDALRAGAWYLLEPPFDPEFLLLYLDVFVRAKREADRFRDAALLDEETGFYTRTAVERRAQELTAWAARAQEPIACLILTPASQREDAAAARSLTRALRSAGRRSDTIGRVSDTAFAVLAPATDAAGALRMAQRLAETTGAGFDQQLRAGYSVWDRNADPADGLELIEGARRALEHSGNGEGWIAAWDGA